MRVLVTGARRGIGKAISDEFSRNGYDVIAPLRDELDLLSRESVESFIDSNKLTPIDAIVNNAGVNIISEIESFRDDDLNTTLEIDLISPLRLIRGFMPQLKNSKCARVVNIASIWAEVSKPGRGMYTAAKCGLLGIGKTLSLELAPFGVLVNTICPGFVETELTKQNNTEKEIIALEKQIPLGRLARPEEIAHLVYYLGSEENTYITGQDFCIDGGFTAQ